MVYFTFLVDSVSGRATYATKFRVMECGGGGYCGGVEGYWH